MDQGASPTLVTLQTFSGVLLFLPVFICKSIIRHAAWPVWDLEK